MSEWIRKTHRWVALAFTGGVIAYMVVMIWGTPPWWVGLFALVPLILQLVSGLYLFVLPYAQRRQKD